MWKKDYLCTTWKVIYCHYVEKFIRLHCVENAKKELGHYRDYLNKYLLSCPNMNSKVAGGSRILHKKL